MRTGLSLSLSLFLIHPSFQLTPLFLVGILPHLSPHFSESEKDLYDFEVKKKRKKEKKKKKNGDMSFGESISQKMDQGKRSAESQAVKKKAESSQVERERERLEKKKEREKRKRLKGRSKKILLE